MVAVAVLNLLWQLFQVNLVLAFTSQYSSHFRKTNTRSDENKLFSTTEDPREFPAVFQSESNSISEAAGIKEELLTLARRTNRGFQASSADRSKARELILDLAKFNPTPEPASPYYANSQLPGKTDSTLAGKWTLVYTDAPDITSLDTSRNPFSTAELGRIGQECNPPYIKNVIEWKRPSWAGSLPFSGNDDSRILQKVVTSGEASPDRPMIVTLKVAGLELEAAPQTSELTDNADLSSRIQTNGLVAGLLSANPIDLKGPLNPPFGQFEVLYLDPNFRMIKTYQNYLAVNVRINEGEEWF